MYNYEIRGELLVLNTLTMDYRYNYFGLNYMYSRICNNFYYIYILLQMIAIVFYKK